ncbi:UDP-glucose 4-epimerase GalE [Aegicerativicinus sediminis]|uniref:UDP-glucose 4-epimerase GalE n=1 Tax=Aegicerativicinus sediminis TaxID=2893202 RepID=UPI001E5B4CC3|nr:UDP-glucose 4-epimerase GalE [Aegicerativicinus sediminis]
MKVLVTGGLGFIGSHTVVELINAGHEVVIIDDLSNSSLDVLQGIHKITEILPEFEKIDLREKPRVEDFFSRHNNLDGIIHFAASKAVGESVQKPLLYYENNLTTLVYILQQTTKLNRQNLIFSSSCTVYGQADEMPIKEESPVKPAESPYGNTKQIGEEILRDTCKVYEDLNVISLRYFNPIGAHESALIGELPIGVPQNLVPFITQSVAGIRGELSVFGDDYPTPDGTCIRDYIHVVDLAKAHVVALERLMNGKTDQNYEVFNVGTGKGSSVLEVIQAFENANGLKVNYRIAPRREGDVIMAYADTTKSNEILGWKSQLTLEDAMRSAWNWEKYVRKID